MTDRDRLVPDEGLTPASEALPGAAGPLKLDKPPRSQWADVWDQFKHHKGAMAGGIIFLAIVLTVFLGPLVWTVEPTLIDIRARNQGMSLEHPFGTDQLGRDMFARMMAGGRTIGAWIRWIRTGSPMGSRRSKIDPASGSAVPSSQSTPVRTRPLSSWKRRSRMGAR